MDESKTKEEFKRWQTIYLVSEKKLRAEEVADIVNISPKTVYQWLYYLNKGESNLVSKQRGGRRNSLMTWEEEEAFLKEMTEQSNKGAIVIISQIKEKAEKILGYKVSKDYPYDLLHRHGWRKISPRTKHPNSNPEEQEEFKKNFLNIWKPPY
jgi:transposase